MGFFPPMIFFLVLKSLIICLSFLLYMNAGGGLQQLSSARKIFNFYVFFQGCSPPGLVLSLSPGLGPDGLPSPGSYFNAGSSCNGSPPPLTSGNAAGSPRRTTGGSHRNSPCDELIAAAMSANSGEFNFHYILMLCHLGLAWFPTDIEAEKKYSVLPNKGYVELYPFQFLA